MSGIRLSKDSEIDFSIKDEGHFIPIECKAAKGFKLQHAYAVLNYCKLFGLKHGIVVNFGPPATIKKDGVNIYSLPVYLSDKISKLVR